MQKITLLLAFEIKAEPRQIEAAVALLDSGATVPFIARYRKEATGGLDDIQLRLLEQRLGYLRELQERREAILRSIAEQGKLTPVLQLAIDQATTKQDLEDIYLPYKPRRRTKAQIAREAGLEPLADLLLAQPDAVPAEAALGFVKAQKNIETGDDFTSVQAVLDGARDIVAERWAEDAVLVQSLRNWLWNEALFCASLASGKDENQADVAKFRDYFDYSEPFGRVPSHRALAVFRGRALEILDTRMQLPEPPSGLSISVRANSASKPALPAASSVAEGKIALHTGWSHAGRSADDWIRKCVAWCWRVKLSMSLERDLYSRLREAAEIVAIKVFADNLRDLLMAAPAGPQVVLGLDPGIRSGVKAAVVDGTGKLLETATVYPHEPRRDWEGALHTLHMLGQRHGVTLIAIGNGTASRETDKLAGELVKLLDASRLPAEAAAPKMPIQRVVVSEAGASVYSASEYASEEMPDIDVSLRGAASIARRLQDPLAELVKIDPKAIGVGQYQHDVSQADLARSLNAVVEDCVNRVGVDVNTASVPLLARVSGLSMSTAKSVVRWREAHGAFDSRADLLKVTGLGAKTFEQSAGFLRVRDGSEPLDMTGVHPETYRLVHTILAHTGKTIHQLMGHSDWLKSTRAESFATEKFGALTVQSIFVELEKPGRDPRPHFKVARFNDGIESMADLKAGMVLEGTVSNVAAFGAFVDIGVHQDGLVHVSQLSSQFVADPHTVVKTGDIVKVQVTEVDISRKRIGLTMRLGSKNDTAANRLQEGTAGYNRFDSGSRRNQPKQALQPASQSALADAFERFAKQKK